MIGCSLPKREREMVSWYWLIIAFMGGAFFGAAFLAACVAAGRADRAQEKRLQCKEADLSSPDSKHSVLTP